MRKITMMRNMSGSAWRIAAWTTVLALAFGSAGASASELPAPWSHQDIGDVAVKGDASQEGGAFTLAGTFDIWGKADGFQLVYRPMEGDGQIVARVTACQNTNGHAKAGVTIRESLAAAARHATIVVTAVDGTQYLKRTETGDVTTVSKTGRDRGVFPYWVKLVRAGDTFTAYESGDGKEWTLVGTDTVKMGPKVYAGLVSSSHQKTVTSTAKIDHVTIESSRP
jgi:hypothetical protein